MRISLPDLGQIAAQYIKLPNTGPLPASSIPIIYKYIYHKCVYVFIYVFVYMYICLFMNT
jgi:hypothetical protein